MRFEYVERTHCACGEPLRGASEQLVKPHVWGEVRFQRCPSCRSWNQAPQIAVESLARWYDSDAYQAAAKGGAPQGIYLDYEASEPQRLAEAAARYQQDIHPRFAEGGHVLEVGCASASLLAVMHEAGWAVTGIDLSARFAEMGTRLNNVEVEVGDFLDARWPAESFDLVVMLGTVSNVQDISAHLSKVREMLRPGGWFYFNFPVADSWIYRFYGNRFWMFTPSVSTFFSINGMRAALWRAGFGEVRFGRDEQRPSFAKVLSQAKLTPLYKLFTTFGLADNGLPFSLPIPGIAVGLARRD